MSNDEPEGQVGTDPRKHFREIEVTEDEQRRIEEERKQRLDPANRPENSEVDNTDVDFEIPEEFDQEGPAGSDPRKRFREMEVSEEEQREIEEERKRRLDPANRPENAEVDNTHRITEDGKFVDED